MLDGLKSRGFMYTSGIEDTGLFLLALTRGGGYYIGAPFCAFRFVTEVTSLLTASRCDVQIRVLPT